MRNGACGGREKTLLSLCTWVCYTFWEHECLDRLVGCGRQRPPAGLHARDFGRGSPRRLCGGSASYEKTLQRTTSTASCTWTLLY